MTIFAFSSLGIRDFIGLLHPAIAIIWTFPLIGIVTNFAWQTRQRRLEIKGGKKSKIAPSVGKEHLQIGKQLAGSVVALSLIALGYSLVFKNFIASQKRGDFDLNFTILICLIFIATIISFVLLYRARKKIWRGIFATLTGMGLIILGSQEGVWRLTKEWYWSHYYYGIVVSLLMIFSVATIEDIYRDKTNSWRKIHIILNCFALLLFIGQGITGARDLLELSVIGKG